MRRHHLDKEMPMRRTLLIAGLLFLCSVPLAQTLTEIEYPIYGAGGGKSSAATHSVNVAIGQAVVGRSTATSHSLLHGPWPYRSGTPTDAPEEQTPEDQIPAVQFLQLRPNVPNPFNPGTEIRYDVPTAAGPVSVHVYDAQGRLVRVLVDADATPGRRSVMWNGLDDSGRPLASGVYYAVLTSAGTRHTRKMTLLK
jgi:hypothetical protein